MSGYESIKTYRLVNWILFAVGLGIVDYSSHGNWLALFGAWIASVHLTRKARLPCGHTRPEAEERSA